MQENKYSIIIKKCTTVSQTNVIKTNFKIALVVIIDIYM
jgi:hypothetical protein